MSNIKDIVVQNKSKVIIMLLLIIFSIIMIIFTSHKDEDKIYKNQKYVYTMETNEVGGFSSLLPYINIKGDEISAINKEIMTKYYKENILGERYTTYEYYQNKNIISLLIKYQYLEGETDLSLEIDFYNIDLNTNSIFSDEELLNIYGVDNNYTKNIILEKIKDYYEYEKKNNYITDCDFDCYKERLGDNVLDGVKYYVKKNSLYACKYFQIDRELAYDGNIPFDLFRFKIK